MVEINEAIHPTDVVSVRELFIEYQAALGVDLCFQGFAAELENLPGDYAPPSGCLLLARSNGAIAGCIAMRAVTEETCEMKRLYVRPSSRAGGVGRQLVERVIAEARRIGYQQMVLDTLPTMERAQRLYESLGFKDVAAYRHNPIAGTRYLGLDL